MSLAEAVQLTLRVADGLDMASRPLGASAGREDLLVFHIDASNHRGRNRQLFVQMAVKASKDGSTARVFHTVEATLYLTGEPHYCPNHVPEELVEEVRKLLGKPSSAILATFSTSLSDSQDLRDLSLSVVENLLAGVQVAVP